MDGLEQVGLWVRCNAEAGTFTGRPGLFLDRDGVVNADTGYPSKPEEIALIDAIVPLIREANRRGLPVIVVSNQSGVGRGYMGWPDYVAVTDRIEALLADRGARLDCILASAYHEDGLPPYAHADHPTRKPNPGMLLRGAALTGADLAASVIVGDRQSDMEAGRRAGLKAGWLFGPDADATVFADAAYQVRVLTGNPLRVLAQLD